MVDTHGDHCLSCPGGGDRTKRHNFVRNCSFNFCADAGLNPEAEKPGLLMPRPNQGVLAEDGRRQQEGALGAAARRPADIYLPR